MTDFHPTSILCMIGSRQWNDIDRIRDFLLSTHSQWHSIVTGTAFGADSIVQAVCNELDIPCHTVFAKWWNENCDHTRNQELFDMADEIIILWDGRSSSTQRAIALAHEQYPHKPKQVWYL